MSFHVDAEVISGSRSSCDRISGIGKLLHTDPHDMMIRGMFVKIRGMREMQKKICPRVDA